MTKQGPVDTPISIDNLIYINDSDFLIAYLVMILNI